MRFRTSDAYMVCLDLIIFGNGSIHNPPNSYWQIVRGRNNVETIRYAPCRPAALGP